MAETKGALDEEEGHSLEANHRLFLLTQDDQNLHSTSFNCWYLQLSPLSTHYIILLAFFPIHGHPKSSTGGGSDITQAFHMSSLNSPTSLSRFLPNIIWPLVSAHHQIAEQKNVRRQQMPTCCTVAHRLLTYCVWSDKDSK